MALFGAFLGVLGSGSQKLTCGRAKKSAFKGTFCVFALKSDKSTSSLIPPPDGLGLVSAILAGERANFWPW